MSTHKDSKKPTAEQLSKITSNWTRKQVCTIYHQAFNDLIYYAHSAFRANFNHNEVQLSTLINIKSGGCPEDCAYCPQSAHYETHAEVTPLMEVDKVVEAAKAAKQNGAKRFCMGAAWRSPKDKDIKNIQTIIKSVKSEGLETCATLGMLSEQQAIALADAGLDYYNHNIDSSPEYYEKIISTRNFKDRLNTLEIVRSAGMKVCCGGIVGMGEAPDDRVGFLYALATMDPHPESVPINMLVRSEGTPLENSDGTDWLQLVRTIATARILMPMSYIRLSAGRAEMSEELQAICFFAGANSIFYGDKLLTTENPETQKDLRLLSRLGISPQH